jgi:ubiquinone/menaquinone biosynthesis C-methylase UbiE
MNHEAYTPGHTRNSTDFMAERSFESHGSFFAPYIDRSHIVLDVGCGPGSISIGIARAVSSGRLHAVDFGESQINTARVRPSRLVSLMSSSRRHRVTSCLSKTQRLTVSSAMR